ncbi:dehydrogenase/reductase SDR family member 7B-like [Ruditapes philippinarum]|uniref:dehydrogenase/reductase SDR family member 7B-like n=1 Tax=Ruditapes philippinarum TaxID=129788 RepID=UPI00295AE283|nr:dehydrogenase/reductase SDR family member 7B-like [Ruditapes philippinarum]XP_060580243.1 dehydrogenase/reductase SDR family member 7B-like [Ruditapes philippinarum]
MTFDSLLVGAGGTASLLYLIYWLLNNRKKTDVTGKVVLITGAGSGLGKACAEVFFKHGCKVILAGRNVQQLQEVKSSLADQLPKHKSHLAVLQVDLADVSSLEKKGDEAVDIFGHVDILINNAGISYRGSIQDTDIDVHMKVMTVNYFGQIALTKAILPHMQQSRSGHIVAVSSVQGRISQAYRSAYAVSKHAIQAYFDCLRAEMSSSGIHVCVVSPGYIQTNLSRNAVCADGSNYGVLDKTTAEGLPPEKVASLILKAVESHQPEIIPAKFIYRLVIILRALFPRLVFWILAKRAKKQRKDYIKST